MVFVNKMDIVGADFYNVLNMMHDRLKCNAVPIQLPIGVEDTFKGIIDLVEKAGAELAGMGFIIEKSFQHGGDYLRNAGIRIESLAIIDSLDNCEIKIR